MVAGKKTRQKVEFGDFQTPAELARAVCFLLSGRGLRPRSVLEPTCGEGSFLVAALHQFPSARKAIGLEINRDCVNTARAAVRDTSRGDDVHIIQGDFFTADWTRILPSLPDPLLVIGNPPWVTNAALSSLGSANLPHKSNFQNRRGFDAITGKSNFDISEWMLIQALRWIDGRRATLAMLCKTAVARRALLHAWKTRQRLEIPDIHRIDAAKYFGAAVDACLLIVTASSSARRSDCRVHDTLERGRAATVFGCREGGLVADVTAYDRWKHLHGTARYKWRSGIKHDCTRVMEFREENGQYRNGLGELVDLEDEYLYPMLKGAVIANAAQRGPARWMLVTQRSIGADTNTIPERAPKTWKYLRYHADLLDRRSSAIYRNRPRFSIFGVGDYSFALWKVAISGFHKKLDFAVIGPRAKKPVVLDDTCYFLACEGAEEAEYLASLLNSQTAKEFFSAFVFWDAKRPVTVDLLRRLDLLALAKELDSAEMLKEYLLSHTGTEPHASLSDAKQGALFP